MRVDDLRTLSLFDGLSDEQSIAVSVTNANEQPDVVAAAMVSGRMKFWLSQDSRARLSAGSSVRTSTVTSPRTPWGRPMRPTTTVSVG
jgi:hypothetical protein